MNSLFTRTQIFFIVVAIIVFGIAVVLVAATADDHQSETPFGCTWIDLDPGKSNNTQLACVEGYGWDR